MSFPKLILIVSISIFSLVGVIGLVKKFSNSNEPALVERVVKVIPPLEKRLNIPNASAPPLVKKESKSSSPASKEFLNVSSTTIKTSPLPLTEDSSINAAKDTFVDIDRIHQLYTTASTKLPIVETVSYSSKVSWLKGRPAWVADYASHYGTSHHFIARSLNGKPDYLIQKITSGNRFNVFRKDKKIDFHLLIDVTQSKMAFYYYDHGTNERVLLKTYRVGLGKVNTVKQQDALTPIGNFLIGSKVGVYKPGVMGYFQGKKIEMINIFGTRWLPFEEIKGGPPVAKGYGIHGTRWVEDKSSGKFIEDRESLRNYDGGGCVRLISEDVEELFSIVITKPTFVYVVKDFHDAKLPGVEVATPTR